MKVRIWLSTFLIVMMLGSVQADDMALIQGSISNAAEGEIKLAYNTNLISYNPTELSVTLGDDGQFSFELSLESMVEVMMVFNNQRLSLIAYPGDQMTLELNGEAFASEVQISGSGKGILASKAMLSYEEQFAWSKIGTEQRRQMRTESAAEFMSYAQGFREEQREWFSEWKSNEEMPADFLSMMNNRIEYGYASLMFTFPNYYAYYQSSKADDEAEIEELEVPGEYYSFLTELSYQDDAALSSSSYRSYTRSYFRHMLKAEMEEGQEEEEQERSMKDELKLAPSYFEGKTLGYVQGSMIMEALQYGDREAGIEAYQIYETQAQADSYLDEIRPIYELTLSLMPGKPAPEFTLVNLDGEEVSLKDFRGKVVYLDFWASWCGPCIAEMPHAKELKKKMEGEDVVFLYVSIDDTQEAWRKGVEDNEMKGVLLWSEGFRSATPKAYGVQGIPSYFLINRDGTIYSPNPDRPSGDEVEAQIRAAMDQESSKSRK